MPTPKKPTNLHILNGNPSKIKDLGKNEPKPAPKKPDCPDWLPGEARKIWEEEAPKLEKLGLLTEIDGEEFARYCATTYRARQAEVEVEKNGIMVPGAVKGTMVKNVAVAISRDYHAAATKMADKFGMNPVARTRIETPGEEEADPMESLLSR